MEFFIVILFIWMIFIQAKLNNISKELEFKVLNSTAFKENQEGNNESYLKQEPQQLQENEVQESEKIPDNTNILGIGEVLGNSEIQQDNRFNFETVFLGNIFNKIGALAIIIGIIIFIKIVSTYIVFTPAIKITTAYLASILMLIIGLRIKPEKMKGFKETLFGTAISASFITTYCAYTLFHLFTPIIATIVATIILIGVYILADKQKTISMIVIALIAGYLNPVLTNSNVSGEFLFSYYIFINLLSIIYAYKNPNRYFINFINLGLTAIILALYIIANRTDISVFYPITLWLIYLGYDIVRKEKKSDELDINNILNWYSFAILAVFTYIVFKADKFQAGFLLLATGLLYFGLALKYIKNNAVNYKPYIYSAIVTIFLSTFLMANGIWRTGFWCLESVVLSFIVYYYKINFLANWPLLFLSAAVTNCLFSIFDYVDTEKYKPILNLNTLNFSFPIISSGLSCILYKKANRNKLGEFFKFVSFSLIYIYSIFEINFYLDKLNSEKSDIDFISCMLTTVLGFMYSIQAKRFYNISNFIMFNIAAYFIGFLSLLVLIFSGFEYSPIQCFHPIINMRCLAYIFAIMWSIFYARWTKFEFFKYLAVILGFTILHIETADYISSVNTINNIDYLITVCWLLYAGIITLIGIFKNKKFLKNTGIWISIATIFRIFIFDLADTDMNYKLIAFLTLGIILMLVSYFYNKRS